MNDSIIEIEAEKYTKEYEKQDDTSEDDKVCMLYKLPPYPPITEDSFWKKKISTKEHYPKHLRTSTKQI